MTPDPSPLTDDQLAELRDLLLSALDKLRRSMAATDAAAEPVELDQTAVGRLSRMDSLQSLPSSGSRRGRTGGATSATARSRTGGFWSTPRLRRARGARAEGEGRPHAWLVTGEVRGPGDDEIFS